MVKRPFIYYVLKHWTGWMAWAHSKFGHYFCSNLYGRAPRGPRGVKKSEFFLQKNVEFFPLELPQKGTNFKKLSKLKTNVKKTLFSESILNMLQFGGNICAPNLKWSV